MCCVQIDNCVGGYVYNRELAKKYFGTDAPEELEAQLPSLDSLIEVADKLDGDYIYAAVQAEVDRFGLVRNVCGMPTFDHPGVAPEGQAFYILMETARSEYLQ